MKDPDHQPSNKVSNKGRQIFTYSDVTATLSMSSAFGDLYELKCLFGRKSITKQKFAISRLFSGAFPMDFALFLIFSEAITPAAWMECMCSTQIHFNLPFHFDFSFDYVLFNLSSCQVIRQLRSGHCPEKVLTFFNSHALH